MADNTGPYLSYAELIQEFILGGSAIVTEQPDLVLTNQNGLEFDFTSGTPELGAVVSQMGAVDTIVSIVGSTITLLGDFEGNTKIVNGTAKMYTSVKVPRYLGEELIAEASEWFDELTGQFFNKREGTFKIQGNNTPTLFLPVPVIEVTSLKINSTGVELTEGELDDYYVFDGRAKPQDDRRNPRISLNIGRQADSIFTRNGTNRLFLRQSLTEIVGSFGFLEPDGSTPRNVKKAVKKLAIISINSPAASATESATGPLKRRKTDLHEIEFFELKEATSRGALTGDSYIDEVVAKYRRPIAIGGSFELKTSAINKAAEKNTGY